MSKIILVIEDEIFLQGLEATKLKRGGYEVLTAINSIEAYKILDSNIKIDLVLLDLMLPEVNGFTILEKIRQDKKLSDLKVLIFSNLSEKKDIERAKKLGISDFMIKSDFDLDQLVKKVKETIGQ